MQVLQSIGNIFLLKNKEWRPHNTEYLTGDYLNYFITPNMFISAEPRPYFMKPSEIKSTLPASSE